MSKSYGLGVSCDVKRKGKQFRARVFHQGLIDLGRYSTAYEACVAYDQAVLILPGPAKPTNFCWDHAAQCAYNPDIQEKVLRHLSTLGFDSMTETGPTGDQSLPQTFSAYGSAADTVMSSDEESASLFLPDDLMLAAYDAGWADVPQGTFMPQAGTMPGMQEAQLLDNAAAVRLLPGCLPDTVANVTAGATQGAAGPAQDSPGVTAAAQDCMPGMQQLQMPDLNDIDFAALLVQMLAEDLQADGTVSINAAAPAAPDGSSAMPAAQQQQQQMQCSPGVTALSTAASATSSSSGQQPLNTIGFSPASANTQAAVNLAGYEQQHNGADTRTTLAAASAAAHGVVEPEAVDAAKQLEPAGHTQVAKTGAAAGTAAEVGCSCRQRHQPHSALLPALTTSGDVVRFVDTSVFHLAQLYARLTPHQEQHAGLVTIQWVAEVRAGVSETVAPSSSSQGTAALSPVCAAILHLCASLVSLGAGSNTAGKDTGPFDPCFLASVIELLMKSLMSLRARCASISPAQGISCTSLQAWQGQLQGGAVSRAGRAVADLLSGLMELPSP